jgi:hypothetical protein
MRLSLQGTTLEKGISERPARANPQAPEEPLADFMIRRDRENRGIIQGSGSESPGLTCYLAVGNLGRDLVCKVPPRRSFKQ